MAQDTVSSNTNILELIDYKIKANAQNHGYPLLITELLFCLGFFFFSQWKLPDDPPCDISPTPYHFLLFHFFKPTHKFKSIQGWIARFDPLRPIIRGGGESTQKLNYCSNQIQDSFNF
jgi:hypothetical protein